MTRNYCTLFDINYAAFGLALYRSLARTEQSFHLYILCMDDQVHGVLTHLKLPHVTVINRQDFFPEILSDFEKRMTPGQICWASQPLICKYILDFYKVDHIVYMDSDCYFVHSPDQIWDEILAQKSISATVVPHRFSPSLHHLEAESGKYCVQFNYFNQSASSRVVLQKWIDDCFLYSKEAPYWYPGQISLNNWQSVSPDVLEIQNPGAGVAVWNNLNFNWNHKNEFLIFFHFHGLYFISETICDLGGTFIHPDAIREIYKPYIQEVLSIRTELKNIFPQLDFLRFRPRSTSYISRLKSYWSTFKRKRSGLYQVYDIRKLIS